MRGLFVSRAVNTNLLSDHKYEPLKALYYPQKKT